MGVKKTHSETLETYKKIRNTMDSVNGFLKFILLKKRTFFLIKTHVAPLQLFKIFQALQGSFIHFEQLLDVTERL